MTKAARRIPISKDSDLGKLLDEAHLRGEQVELEVNGHSFRLTPQPRTSDDPWESYDPEKVRQALRRTAGAFKGIDRDQLVADLREQRAQDSQGRPA